MKRAAFLFCLALFLAVPQTHAQNPNYFFEHIGVEDGLPNPVVAVIHQDHKGFIWFGTFTGLSRYDGHTLKNYFRNNDDSTALLSDRITSMLEDSHHRLWIGTHEGGLHLYNRKHDNFIRYTQQSATGNNITSDQVEVIFEDPRGRLWIGTSNGLNLYDTTRNRFEPIQLLAANGEVQPPVAAVSSLAMNSRGEILALVNHADIYVVQVNERTMQKDKHNSNLLDGQQANAIFRSSEKAFYISSLDKGMIRVNEAFDARVQLTSFQCKAIVEDQQSNIWIGTDGQGIQIIHPDKSTSYLRASDEDSRSLSSNAIYSIFCDRAGNIWIGTFGGGVNVYHPAKMYFEQYTHNSSQPGSLSHKSVLSIFEDQQGNVWVGTDGGGLNRFNKTLKTFTCFRHDPHDPHSIPSDVVKAIYQDRKGTMYIGTYLGGLATFDPTTGKFNRIRSGDEEQNKALRIIWDIFEDRNDKLWISTLGHGVFVYDKALHTFAQIAPYQHEGLNDHNVFDIFEYPQGVMWLGTENQGLNLLDTRRQKFTHFKNINGNKHSLSNNHSWIIRKDNQNEMWIGTAEGLNHFNPATNTFERITHANGLPSDIILNVLEDHMGHLWIATGVGISRYDRQTRSIKSYTSRDGIQENFNINAGMVSAAGEIYLGGPGGLNVFNPAIVNDNRNIAPIVFTDFEIFNQSVDIDKDGILTESISEVKEVSLPYSESFITISFALLDYTAPEKNTYRYRLNGSNSEEWVTTNSNEAIFTNLNPGTYLLEVMGANNDGFWNEVPATLTITIIPPWWNTIWFEAAVIIVFICIIYGLYRYRIFNLQKMMELEKTQQRVVHEASLREQHLLHEKNIIEINHHALEQDIQSKNSQLACTVMNVVKQNEVLLNIIEQINLGLNVKPQPIEVTTHFRRIIKSINNEVRQDESWVQFEQLFNEIHENFFQKLKERFPELTPRDLKICAYLRMNLDTKEIATLLNVSIRGLEDFRYRIRKKMQLDSSVNLTEFILQL